MDKNQLYSLYVLTNKKQFLNFIFNDFDEFEEGILNSFMVYRKADHNNIIALISRTKYKLYVDLLKGKESPNIISRRLICIGSKTRKSKLYIRKYFNTPICREIVFKTKSVKLKNIYYQMEDSIMAIAHNNKIACIIMRKKQKNIELYGNDIKYDSFRLKQNMDTCYYIDSMDNECPIIFPYYAKNIVWIFNYEHES